MHKLYEVPHLTVIGQANHIVLGSGPTGMDNGHFGAPDFEFEHDCPLI